MREALRVAGSSEGAKIGAILVRDGELFAEGRSLVRPNCDPTAHAEVNAIRDATAKQGHFHLDRCALYSTLEPCGMCLSACAWANLGLVVFGADWSVTPDIYYEQEGYCALDRARYLLTDGRRQPLAIVGGCLGAEAAALLPAREAPASSDSRFALETILREVSGRRAWGAPRNTIERHWYSGQATVDRLRPWSLHGHSVE